MKRRFLYIFLLIFMVGFLFWPNTGSSELNPEEIIKNQEQIELKEKDAEDILKSLIQKISDEWIEVTTSSNFILEEQAVLVILSKGIKINAMRYLLLDVPIEIGKVVIKATIKVVNLILAEDPSLIIDEVEKLTVKKAKEYAINWLLQNEIKVTKGNLKVSYFAYNRKWQKVIFPYIIVYRPLTPTRGEVGINIYSSDFIKTPLPLSGYQWEGGVEELPPFIVKISGEVEKSKTTHYVYSWVKGPEINIDFSGPVPEFEFKEPGFFDKLELSLNKVEVILGKIMDFVEIGDAWNKVKSFLSEISSFTAIMTPDSSSFEDPELDFSEIDLENLPSEEKLTSEVEEIIEKEKELSELVQEIEAISEASSGAEGMGLDEIQEIIDDIAERIDVINQEIAELVGEIQQTSEEITDETEELTEESEEGEQEEEKEEEEEEEVGQKEIGQEMSDLCQKIEGSYPARNKIIFNEVAWMGTLESANDEWIELKNISGGEINLTGWQLLDKEQQIKIIFDNKDRVSANGFYLLERTDDDSVSQIAADSIYTGGLSNTDEALYLFDENCQLQDEIEAFPDWSAGDNSSKRTMERKSNLGWQASVRSGGTPKRENSSGYVKTSGGGGGGGGGGVLPTPVIYPKVLISEIQISPIEQRFIELYNPNESEVNLTGWYIQRKTKDATSWSSLITSTHFEGKTIQPKSYFFIPRAFESSDILFSTLTLTEDNSIVLKNPKREIVDLVGWGEAPAYETVAFSENPRSRDLFEEYWTEQGLDFSHVKRIGSFTVFHQSLGRKVINEENSYQDTDNNAEDFEIQTPTPKAENKTFIEQELEDVLKDIIDYYNASILEVSLQNLEFSIIEPATPSQSQTFTISNSGEGILEWIGIVDYTSPSDADWLKIEPDSGTAPSEVSVSLSQDVSGLGKGDYEAKIVISAKGAEESPKKIEVILNVVKAGEGPAGPAGDTIPPEIVFTLEPVQTSLSFTISWQITDKALETATPSGLDSFVFRWKEENEEGWQEDEYQEITEAPINYSGELEFTGEDEKTYYFQIKAKDVAGNEGDWLPDPTAFTKISIPKKVLINEVQIDNRAGTGGADDDWVELYNPNEVDISLTGWSIQEHSSSDPCSISKGFYKKNFPEEAVIPAKAFFLIVDTEAGESLKNIADITIGWSLTEDNTVYLVKDQEEIGDGEDLNIVDKVGFGRACFPEKNAAPNPPEEKSIRRKELGIDTNDNSQDFEINDTPSPTNSKGETFSLPSYFESPWPMFQHDAQHTGRSPFVGPATLDDPDTQIQILIEGEADDDYFGTPVIGSDGTLYLIARITTGGETKEGLFAFSYNGSQKWVYEITSPFNKMPVLRQPSNTVYVAHSGGLLAIDSENGNVKWSKTGFSASLSQNLVVSENGVLYFVAGIPDQPSDWGLYAVDDEGQILWVCPISPPETDLTIGKQGNIYFGRHITLFAIDPNGILEWQKTFEDEEGWSVKTPVVGDNGIIYVIGGSRCREAKTDSRPCLNAIDPDNHEEEKWRYCGGYFHTSPVISSPDNIYIPYCYMSWDTFKTKICGIDMESSNSWCSEGYYESLTSLIVDNAERIYSLYGNQLRVFDQQLELIWSVNLDNRTGPLSLGGDGSLFIPGTKKLYMIKLR